MNAINLFYSFLFFLLLGSCFVISKKTSVASHSSIKVKKSNKVKDSPKKIVYSNILNRALRQTSYEQEIEDQNSIHKIDNHMVRKLIVMPLKDTFQPNQADLMHGKIQYGDKCSLPSSLGKQIFDNKYEVPWIFELKPIRSDSNSVYGPQRIKRNLNETTCKSLSKAYISPLDFRSPENYIFLPQWLMKDLDLSVNDLVEISMVRIKLASLVVLQPLSLDWDDLIKSYKDPKLLLEHELNKYSSLTAGTTIYISIDKKEYPLFVKETFAEGGISVKGVRVQDADIKTDIDRSILDKLLEAKKLAEKKDNVDDLNSGL